jgi:hypothetical protein
MMLAAITVAAFTGWTSHTLHSYFSLAVLALAAATSRMKAKFPGINGNMSVNLPFLLIAVANLSAAESALITCVSAVVQCWPRKNASLNRPQMAFNLSMMVFATASASLIFHSGWLNHLQWNSNTFALILATCILFLGQTVPVSGIVAISEGKSTAHTWQRLALLSFPHYVVGAGITSMVLAVNSHLGWKLALAVFPVMYGIHRSYKLNFTAMADNMRSELLVKAAGVGA